MEGSRGISNMDYRQRIRRQKNIESKGAIERLVPGSNTTGKHSAHRQGASKTIGIQLNQASRDDAAQRVTPGNCAGRMTTGRNEIIKQCDLILECLLDCPAVLAIRRPGKRIALIQERSSSQSITGIGRRVEKIWGGKYIAVAVEDQRSIPVRRDGNSVVGPSERAMERICSVGGDTIAGSLGNDGFSVGSVGESQGQAT